jgi:predicted MFS family arabinose efflux permease
MAHDSADTAPGGPAYRGYVLGMLTVVVTFSYIDRCLITLLLEPIKQDLKLSDTELGFLTGIAFGLFYATLGLPIARWADTGNRSRIAALAVGLWGLTVMCCLMVTNFVQLLFARIAAAVGEAGCLPPTYSLVGDYFPAASARTRAMTVYMLASPLATMVSFAGGGWLNDHFGWRMTFFLMGVPALFVAALFLLSVREPGRAVISRPPDGQGHIRAVASVLWRQRSSRHLTIGIVLFWTMGLGLMPWYAAFMMRSHGMGTTELGLWLGLIAGGSGGAGILLGGFVADRLFGNNERAQMRMSAVMMAVLVPCFLVFLLAPQKHQALAAFVPLTLIFNWFLGPAFALLQRLVPDGMRATALSVVMLLANLIGMGLGPQIVGVLSDALAPSFGIESLRYAMVVMSLVAGLAASQFWMVARHVREDLANQPASDLLSAAPSTVLAKGA